MQKKSNNTAKKHSRGIIFAGSLMVAILIGTALFHSAAVYAQLQSWKLVPTPEHYTELYFEHSLLLPKTITQKSVAFTFDVHNVEGQTVTYPYTVVLRDAKGNSRNIATSTITLADGATGSISQSTVLPKGTAAAEVSVYLADQQQEIHYWVGSR